MSSCKRYTSITMTTVLPLLLLMCLGATMVQAADNEAVVCRRSWFTLYSESEECLRYMHYTYTWHYAEKLCRNWHATLFYPANDADYTSALTELQVHNHGQGAWMGACKLNDGSYITADNQDFSTIWTGNVTLTAAQNPTGFLEIDSTAPHFTYTNYQYVWYWWFWHKVLPKRHFICGERPCRINCDRLCALIEALEALLD